MLKKIKISIWNSKIRPRHWLQDDGKHDALQQACPFAQSLSILQDGW